MFGANVVYSDQWHLVDLFDKTFNHSLTFHDLFTQFMEHRILFPRIVMLFLGMATNYNTVAEMYFIQACLLTNLIVLLLVFLCSNKFRHNVLFFLPISFLVFSIRQHENMLWGWQIGFALALTFSLLAHYLLFVSERNNFHKTGFAAAMLTATFATFSSAQGLFVWIAGLLQLCLSSVASSKRSFILIWSLVGFAAAIAYFAGWKSSVFIPGWREPVDHAQSGTWIDLSVDRIQYFLTLLGGSLFSERYPALACGSILASLIVFIVVVSIKDRSIQQNSIWFGVLSFSLLVLLSIVFGRAGWGDYTALLSRYSSFSILAIVSIYSILTKSLWERAGYLRKILMGALYLLLAIGLIDSYAKGIVKGKSIKQERLEASFLLSTYESQPDEILVDRLYPVDESKYLAEASAFLKERMPILQRLRYSSFSETKPFVLRWPQENDSGNVTFASIDEVAGISARRKQIEVPQNITFTSDVTYWTVPVHFIIISGWAINPNRTELAGGVIVCIDRKPFPAFYGEVRPDIAENLGDKSLKYSGFRRAINIDSIGSGSHELSIVVMNKDRNKFFRSGQVIELQINGSRRQSLSIALSSEQGIASTRSPDNAMPGGTGSP
jgi:hypothetical protein